MEEVKVQEVKKKSWSDYWWGSMLLGLGSGCLAWYMYHDLSKLEAEGGTKRINALIAMVYRIGGKWAVVGAFVLLALFLLAIGVRDLLAPKRPKAAPAPQAG